ncbi:hypothetical protein GN316_19955 [Xylophilus sp. Kf1]|nr:hypothetical protein [Xylophilus sp. Kf1]
MRIAVLHFSHETVTFLPNDTDVEDFIFPGSPCRDEALLTTDSNAYIAGFVQFAREIPDVELVGIESPLFPKTGTGSGWVTEAAFERFAGAMLQDLQARGPFDGVYLALHGAMAVRGVARPEAELARRVRAIVGPGAFIAGTFDPHGNEDDQFHQFADLAFCVKYYPHYDAHLQGERAARMLIRCIRGDYRPATVCIKIPIITPTVMQWTGASPWMDIIQKALVWEARKPDTFVNVFFGFPWADTPDAGMTVQVTTHQQPALAQAVARDMADGIWRLREKLATAAEVHAIDDGVRVALDAIAAGIRPAVLADHSDRSGHATWLLKALLARGVERSLTASIADGALVARLTAGPLAVGDRFDEAVGGGFDASAGSPVRLTGRVVGIGDVPVGLGGRGKFIAVDIGRGNVVLVSAQLMQVTETSMLTAMGMRLDDFDLFVIKSRVHFRRGFHDSGFSPCIVLVEPPEAFVGTTQLAALPYRHIHLKDYYPYGREAFTA